MGHLGHLLLALWAEATVWAGAAVGGHGRGGHGVAVGRGSHVGGGGGWLWAGSSWRARVAMWAAHLGQMWHIPAQSLETANRCPAAGVRSNAHICESSSCESQVKLHLGPLARALRG